MLNIDKIFYINLDKRVDRRIKMEEDFLNYLPLQYLEKIERFPAVDHTHYHQISKRAAGCAFSQLAVWKKCIDENLDTVLIFEDDMMWKYPEKLEYYFNLFENIDFNLINLGYFPYVKPSQASVHEDLLVTPIVYHCSAYLVKTSFLAEMYDYVEEQVSKLMGQEPILQMKYAKRPVSARDKFVFNLAYSRVKDRYKSLQQQYAIDVAWNHFNKENSKWYQTKDLLAYQRPSNSNIQNFNAGDNYETK